MRYKRYFFNRPEEILSAQDIDAQEHYQTAKNEIWDIRTELWSCWRTCKEDAQRGILTNVRKELAKDGEPF